jgi:hypothetical protein
MTAVNYLQLFLNYKDLYVLFVYYNFTAISRILLQ